MRSWLWNGTKEYPPSLHKGGVVAAEQTIGALLADCAVSRDQHFAVFTSHSSDNQDDSQKMYVYGLNDGRKIFVADAISTDIDFVDLVEDKLIIQGEGLKASYSFDGHLLNEKEVEQQLFRRALKMNDLSSAYFILERRSRRVDLSPAERACLKTDLDSLSGTSLEAIYVAKCFRLMGEMDLADGNKPSALAYFQSALIANPKVGLKQRVAALEKELRG